MPRITPHGRFADASLKSIRAAEALQGLAVAHISEDFAAERQEQLNIDNLTWENFMRELTSAEQEGRLAEFNNTLLQNIVGPVVEQIMAQAQGGEQ